MIRRTEIVTLIKGSPLAAGGPTSFTDELQGGGGQGWLRAWLRVNIALVLGTGSGALTTEPELNVIKSIMLKSDKNDFFVNSVPGRAMYDHGRRYSERAPRRDAIAAATATYSVVIPIYFSDPELARPEDTIIDTGRYQSMNLQVVMGTIADLLSSPGTATVAFTADFVVERTVNRLLPSQLPVRYVSYDQSPPIDLSLTTVVRLDRADGIRIKRILVYAGSGGSVSSPFSGIPVNTIMSTIQMEDTFGPVIPEQIVDLLQEINATDYELETFPAGRVFLDFMKSDENGSLFGSYDTGKKSRVELKLAIKAGAPGSPIVSTSVEQVRELAAVEGA